MSIEILRSKILTAATCLRREKYFPAQGHPSYFIALRALQRFPKVDYHTHLTCSIAPTLCGGELGWQRDAWISSPRQLAVAVESSARQLSGSDNLIGFGIRLNPIKFLGASPSLEFLEAAVAANVLAVADGLNASAVERARFICGFNRGKEYRLPGYSDAEVVLAAMETIHRTAQANPSLHSKIGGIDICGKESAAIPQSPATWQTVLEQVLALGWPEGFLVTIHLGDPNHFFDVGHHDVANYIKAHYRYFESFLAVLTTLKKKYSGRGYRFRIGHAHLLSANFLLGSKKLRRRDIADVLRITGVDTTRKSLLEDLHRERIVVEVCPSEIARLEYWQKGRPLIYDYARIPYFEWQEFGIRTVFGTDSLFDHDSNSSLSECLLRMILSRDASEYFALFIDEINASAVEAFPW